MVTLPTPSQIAGKHFQLYEAYYNQLQKGPDGSIAAMEAAKFLKRSALSDAILSKVWDMSDPQSKGFLDKSGLFLSIKLITLAQTGKDLTMQNASLDLDDVPQMTGEKPVIRPPSVPPAPQPSAFDISPEMFDMYQKMFLTVAESTPGQPLCVPGAKAKGMMLESKLPVEILGRIWDMADTNKDGALDEPEFIIALHLVQTVKRGQPLPASLPPDLINMLKQRSQPQQQQQQPSVTPSPVPPRKASLVAEDIKPESPVTVATPPVVPIVPPVSTVAAAPPTLPPSVSDGWIVTMEERNKYGNLFIQTDKDHDGFISGIEIKDLFLQSGIPQPILAHIWNLCDDQQQGKLTRDQFILAMWLIQRKVTQNIDPPQVLPPEMRIPSLKDQEEVNPEFDLILKEIMELATEKHTLECEILSKESEKKVKNGELKSLQSEFDTLAATLKQLENQKNVAKTKLADLESQVTTLRTQAEQQESTLVEQETELSQKRNELDSIDTEMVDNENEQKDIVKKMDQLVDLQQQSQLKISKLKTQINDLKELESTMKNCLIKYDDCIDNNNYLAGVNESDLRDLGLEFHEICDAYTELKTPTVKEAPAFEEQIPDTTDTFEPTFDTQFDASPFEPTYDDRSTSEAYNDDPFAALRPETAPSWPVNKPPSHDPFGPASAVPKSPAGLDRDPFGSEPFSSAPSAAPNLPPKKPPPPRPAPPKNAPARPPPPKSAASPAPSASSDPFKNDNNFADFANFESAGFSSSPAWGGSMSTSKTKPKSKLPSQQKSPWGDFGSSFSTSTLPTNNNNRPRNKSLKANPTQTRSVSNLDFTEDPFKNYRYEDPFALSVDPFLNNNGNTSNNNFNNNFDPFK